MKRWMWLGVLVVVIVVLWFLISPPRFWLNMTKRVEPTAAVGEQLVEKYGCRGCHRIGGVGALTGPELDAVVVRDREVDPAHVTLRLWLRNPKAVRPTTPMPNFHLSDTEIEAIILYLDSVATARGQ